MIGLPAVLCLGIQWGLVLLAVLIAAIGENQFARRLLKLLVGKLETWRQARSSTPADKPLSQAAQRDRLQSALQIEFFGPGTTLQIERASLRSPLVYAVQGTLAQPFDPSVIEFGLPVNSTGSLPGQIPPDVPTYRLLNSSQRSLYLDWLSRGRRTPAIPQPYVTLYVYGLERRALVDGQDYQAVAVELIDLMKSYGGVFAHRRDLTALLWLTIHLSCDTQPVSRDLVESAVRNTSDWDESLFRYCLATFAQMSWTVPPTLARIVIASHPQATASVVHKRHADKFQSLFERRVQELFPGGLKFELSGRVEKLEYLFLNPTLGRLSRSETRLQARQRVAEDCQQIQDLLTLWGRCTNELKSYDRAHRAAESGELTTEMWEALPEISREDEHPEAEAWSKLIQQGMMQLGRPLVRIEDLAGIKKIEQRGRLTRKQTEQLLTTAYHLGLAVEPDARMFGRNYAWDETVAIFPRRDDTPEDLTTYNAATILLRLGVSIAAADGQVHDDEVRRITSHLSQQFELTATSSERLDHLRYALVHSPTLVGTLEKSLQEKLSLDQRQLVGEFLVGVAAADGTISPEELKALKKAWQTLGLDLKTLNSLLSPPQVAGAQTTEVPGTTIALDQDRIAQIMLDTQRVAEMLRVAMGDDDDWEQAGDFRLDSPLTRSDAAESASPLHQDAQDRTDVATADGDLHLPLPSIAGNSNETTPIKSGAANESDAPAASQNHPRRDDVSNSPARTLWTGLQPRYHPFLKELLTQPAWDRACLDRLARQHGLMLGGALEAINESSFEMTGDWLVSEDGDQVRVQAGLMKE